MPKKPAAGKPTEKGKAPTFAKPSSLGDTRVVFHKRAGRIIKLLTVQEILGEEHVQKM